MNEEKIFEIDNLCVTHTDFDGIASATLVYLALKNCQTKLQDPSSNFSKVKAKRVIITDIAITGATFSSLQNINADTILWIDHHRPFVDVSTLAFPENVKIIVDPVSPSAVELVKKYFSLNGDVIEKITQLGTKADRWQLDSEEVRSWVDITTAWVNYHLDPNILVQALAKLEISGKVKEVLEKYRSEKEEAKKELIKNTIVKEIKGHIIAVGLAPSILSGSESADILLKETGSEVQIVLKKEGWMSFRRAKTSTLNLITLAKAFGGGGHEYASGAVLGKSVTLENFEKIADEIFSKIESVL